MAKDQVGCVLAGATRLAWSVLAKGREGYRQVTAGGEPIVVAAEEGEAPNPSVSLRKDLAKRRCDIALAVASGRVFLKVVRLPTVDDEEIAGIVELQIDKYSPFPVESLVVSHEVLHREAQASVVLLAAAQVGVIEAAGDYLRQAGLKSARVDVACLGWLASLKDAAAIAGEGVQASVVLDDGTPELIVTVDGIPRMFRTLPSMEGAAGASAEDIAQEISMSLLSLELEDGQLGVPVAAVWGDGEMAEALQKALGAIVASGVALASLGSLAAAEEGVARRLGRGGGLDLTPVAWREAEAKTRFRRRLAAGGSAVIAVWLLIMMGLLGYLYYEEQRLEALKQQASELRQPAMDVMDLRRRVFMIQSYVDRQDSALECLREISRLLPAGVELSAFSFRKGESLKVSGNAKDSGSVYAFKDNLDKSALFAGSTLGPLRMSKGLQLFDMDLLVREQTQ